MDEVEAFRRDLLLAKGKGAGVRKEVAEMRARLAVAKPARGQWEAKNGPGRLMDIELLAEMAALLTGSPARGVERQIEAGRKGGILSDSDATGLLEAYRLMWRLQAGTRLITDGALDPAKLGEGACAFLLRETGETSAAALSDRLEAVAGLAEAVIVTQMPKGAQGAGHGETGSAVE
jgi:glutamate-ammonia-ligase adenylyltransferase